MNDSPATDHDLPWDALVEEARHHLEIQTRMLDQMLRLSQSSWAVDIDAGTITFTSGDRQAVAPVQIVGTLNDADSTWMWGWDHPSVPADLAEHARAVRAYGERHGIAQLTTRIVPVTQEEAWDFAAVADLLGHAQCAYRGPAGNAVVFMTFGTPTMTRPDETTPVQFEAAPMPDSDRQEAVTYHFELTPDPEPQGQAAAGATASAAPSPATSAGPALIPVPGCPTPRAMRPSGIPTADDVDTLAGEPPAFNAEQALGVVHSYLRQMDPLYRPPQGIDNLTDADRQRLFEAQAQLQAVFWRRTDDFHKGGVLGTNDVYNLAALTDWDAREVGPRLWQVTYRRPLMDDLSLAEGYLIMLFDDMPQFVDLVEN